MDYYLYIEPYTLFFRKGAECLFYNTLNKKVLKMDVASDIYTLLDQLEMDKCIILTGEDTETASVLSFVDQLRQTFNGDLLPALDGSVPPAVFLPFINNQREFERLNAHGWIEKDKEVIDYLEEVYLYLNGCKTEDDLIWKQFPSYLCSDIELDSGLLIRWLESCVDKQINRIHLLGGDVLMYADLDKIWEVLLRKSININVYYRYELFTEAHKRLLSEAIGQLTFVILMWQVDEDRLSSLVEITKRVDQDRRWLLLITSEEEFELAEGLVDRYSLENSCIKPVYNHHNYPFFEEAVFLDEQDIQSTCLEKRDFYVSQKINKNDFGRLTVLPDGKIYANVNDDVIGDIEKDAIASVLYKEMTAGHSWLRVRDRQPCCDCVYQWLCPSPSNYERVIGKPNLCHHVEN